MLPKPPNLDLSAKQALNVIAKDLHLVTLLHDVVNEAILNRLLGRKVTVATDILAHLLLGLARVLGHEVHVLL